MGNGRQRAAVDAIAALSSRTRSGSSAIPTGSSKYSDRARRAQSVYETRALQRGRLPWGLPRPLEAVDVLGPVASPVALGLHPVGRLVRVQLGRLAEQAARPAVLRALALVVHRHPYGAP